MALIHIKRNHNLSREQAREKVDDIAQTLESEYKVKHAWDGDVLRFERTGAAGVIAVRDSGLEIKIKLAAAFAPIKGKIEKQILEKIDEMGDAASAG